MKYFYFILLLALICTCSHAQNRTEAGVLSATVSGHAYLEGRADYSGITVVFSKQSPSAVSDSTTTNIAGAYSISLAPGNYSVMFYKSGFMNYLYPGVHTFSGVDVLDNVTLQGGTGEVIYGDISGTLYKNTLYVVKGDLNVPAGQTLTIQPGTWIRFDTLCSLNISGTLDAEGTPEDTIIFTSKGKMAGDWGGIKFNRSNDSTSIISYSRIEYSTDGIGCLNGSSATIMGNYITHCQYAGIYSNNSTPRIFNNTIDGVRDGILNEYSRSQISGNLIINMQNNGIVENHQSSSTISGNNIGNCNNGYNYGIFVIESNTIIISNTVNICHGIGILVAINSNPTIIKNIILNSPENGIGMTQNIGATIIGNTLVNNCRSIECWFSGLATVIKDNIIAYSTQTAISNVPLATLTDFGYNDFYGNASIFNGPSLAGAGSKITVNVRGDSADAFLNVFVNPTFVNYPNNLHLQASSHLIDVGDPSLPKDPDSTLVDIGALYYNQSIIEAHFTANPRFGTAPMTVYFNDQSLGVIQSYRWKFGDGDTSIDQSPVHVYQRRGDFIVELRVRGGLGTNTAYDTIHVLEAIPHIISITDVPHDQGGNVRIKWAKSIHDSTGSLQQITNYGVWRKIPSPVGLLSLNKSIAKPLNDSLGLLYDLVANVPAVQAPQYNVTVSTFDDSSSSGIHYYKFLVTAHTSDPAVFFISTLDSGYSVDNIAPIQPSGLIAIVGSEPKVELTWNSPVDPDVSHYDVYRSSANGFLPNDNLKVGTVSTTQFKDENPLTGIQNYYRLIAVDIHGNKSIPSDEISVSVAVLQTIDIHAKWNMVSLPLVVKDNSKATLFPSAVSNAFTYEGSYAAYGTLQSGKGYWLKFPETQNISISGLFRLSDTIDVVRGWNMIGSLSSSIPVTSIGSIPGGIVTSGFFGYDGSYKISGTIEPGKGYWVKATQAGKLVLSSSANSPASGRVHIEETGDMPPAAPEEVAALIPDSYRLEQNYPNPFNPVTRIRYALPASGYVKLTVYNALGQELLSLVDGFQEAGYNTVSFNASGLPSGMYTYRLVINGFTETRKMVLLR